MGEIYTINIELDGEIKETFAFYCKNETTVEGLKWRIEETLKRYARDIEDGLELDI